MPVRELVPADAPVLRQKAKRVRQFDAALRALVEDMLETMDAAFGVGLAAPQIGVPQRVIVIQVPSAEEGDEAVEQYVLCNPAIVREEGEEAYAEGCLSLPGYVGEVTRAAMVTVKGYSAEGKPIRLKGTGLLARALQHEIDHLEGILFTDRLESLDKLHRLGEPEAESAVG